MEKLSNPTELGHLICKVRKEAKLTQQDLAYASGVGRRFIVDLENGKETCHLGKTLKVARMLGISLYAESTLLKGKDYA